MPSFLARGSIIYRSPPSGTHLYTHTSTSHRVTVQFDTKENTSKKRTSMATTKKCTIEKQSCQRERCRRCRLTQQQWYKQSNGEHPHLSREGFARRTLAGEEGVFLLSDTLASNRLSSSTRGLSLLEDNPSTSSEAAVSLAPFRPLRGRPEPVRTAFYERAGTEVAAACCYGHRPLQLIDSCRHFPPSF